MVEPYEQNQNQLQSPGLSPFIINEKENMWYIPTNCVGLNVNGKYDILSKIEEDVLCVTYLVKHYLNNPNFGRFFQLKFYKPIITKESWLNEGIFEQIRNALSINSRLILNCYEYSEWNNIPFTIHDFFEWKTLENIIANRDKKLISSKFSVSCTIEVLKVLESLYASPCEFKYTPLFIHGNLSPSKVIVSQDSGNILLADTGAIGLYTHAYEAQTDLPQLNFIYTSPEQDSFKPISTASDIFSVGLILLDLLSPTFRKKTELATSNSETSFINKRNLYNTLEFFNLNEEMVRVLKKALHPNPEERYQTPAVFIADLNSYLRKQYWVFDIQENIKTVFYNEEESSNRANTHSEINKTLTLSPPKEIVDSIAMDKLTQALEKSMSGSKKLVELPDSAQLEKENKKNDFTQPLIEDKIKWKAAATFLENYLLKPMIFLGTLVQKKVKKAYDFFKTLNKKQILIFSSTAFIFILMVFSFTLIKHKASTNKNHPVLATGSLSKALTIQTNLPSAIHSVAPTAQDAQVLNDNNFINVSINAVPWASIDIPIVNIKDQITPLSSIKIPTTKIVAILIQYNKCKIKKVVKTQGEKDLDLRFNMRECKEY